MSSSSSESDESNTNLVTPNQLSKTSRKNYQKAYDSFIAWRNDSGYNNLSQDVVLKYFKDLAKTKLPSTLWATYSMLKAKIHSNDGINIETYDKLRAFIRNISKGFKSKKTKVWTRSEIETFLKEAPDERYLGLKVILIIGVYGACRCGELVNLRVDDVEKHSDQLLLVKVRGENKRVRSFVIRDEHKEIVEKYMALRPPETETDRFFIRYHGGKCLRQVIGKNKITAMPQEIASFLKLPNPKLYTGHCFRRTAMNFSGGLLPSLRRREEDNSDAVREVFISNTPEKEAAEEYDTISNPIILAATKVEVPPPDSPILSGSPSPHRFEPEKQDSESSPPPQKKERIHELQSGRIKITETINNSGDSKTISIPTKNVTIIFENCTNVSNININF